MATENFDAQFFFYLDHIAPHLDVYEQTVYLYLLGKALSADQDVVVQSIKSGRLQMGFGAGDNLKPMSETSATKRVRSLQDKGLIEVLGAERAGTRFRVTMPFAAEAFQPQEVPDFLRPLEVVDFFQEPEGRVAILEREDWKCFYCGVKLDSANHVMEHVVSRPAGRNTCDNIVASCRSCNNKKGDIEADDFLRMLYRSGILSQPELTDAVEKLRELKAGKLIPVLPSRITRSEN